MAAYLDRLRPHYRIGYAIGALTLVHASAAISTVTPGAFAGLYLLGVWLATLALLVIGGQIWLGLQLQALRGAIRLRMRRWHFYCMLGIVALVAAHIGLNGPAVRTLIGAS